MNIFNKFFLIIALFGYLNADLTIAYSSKTGIPTKFQKEDFYTLKTIAKKNHISITFKALPWKRSLLLVEKGMIDGVINASYKENRAKYANYPMKNNKPDSLRRLNDGASYYIYKNRNSKLVWNGKKFLNPDGKIGVMAKFAVIEDLKKHKNINIQEFDQNVEIIRSVAKGKIAAYAGSSRTVDNLLNKYPSLSKKIVRESIPIRKKEYYIVFSKKIFSKKKKEIEIIWNGLKKFNEKKDAIKF